MTVDESTCGSYESSLIALVAVEVAINGDSSDGFESAFLLDTSRGAILLNFLSGECGRLGDEG